jgi:alpha-amylase
MKLKRFSTALFIAGLLLVIYSPARAGVLMQGYYRDAVAPGKSWWDNLSEKAHEMRSAGFTAVWIPPVLKGASGGFSTGFDPFDDYDIGGKDQEGTIPTHWGKREELERTVAIMRANGLDVYVDTVLNHRNGDHGDKEFRYRDAFGRENGGRFGKTPTDFHRDDKKDQDANVPNDDSFFGPDLKHDNPHVSNGLKQAGDWLTKALGVQGYRLDYVKGISFTFLRDYLNFGAMAGKFAVGEFQGSREDLNNWTRNSMQGRASALDFPLRDLLKEMCDGNGFFDMRRLDHAGLTGINPTGSVTFVESHDTQDNPAARIVNNKHLAYAYTLTSEGYPVVFYRDYFDFGLKALINNLVWIHEKIADGETRERFKDDDVFAYERLGGSHLLAAINDNGATDRTVSIAAGFGPNVQLHDYTGHSGDVFTDGNGNVNIRIPKNSFVAYSRTGIDGGFHASQFAVTQEFAGATDLDIKPADNTDFVTVGRIFAQSGNTIRADLFYDGKDWTPATKIELDLDDPTDTKVSVLARTAADHEFGTMSFVPQQTGWHTFRIRSVDTPAQNEKPIYFLKVTYTAPQDFTAPQNP